MRMFFRGLGYGWRSPLVVRYLHYLYSLGPHNAPPSFFRGVRLGRALRVDKW